MHYSYHVHLQNDSSNDVRLNLLDIWEEIEPEKPDVVTLSPGEFAEFQANYPGYRQLQKRFKAAVAATGNTTDKVWWTTVTGAPE